MQTKNQVNFYLILKVSPQAKSEEIKKAYLKLAQTYHPDKNQGNKLAEKKFQKINEAWQVLKDPQKRKICDEKLKKDKKRKEEQNLLQSKSMKPSAPLAPRKEKSIDLEILLKVSLEDICQSRSKTISYFKPINGTQTKSSFKLKIPLGVKEGTKLYFKGKGGSEGRKIFGDLYVKLQLSQHKIFQIAGEGGDSDLFLERPISFVDAIEGEKIEILSPYGVLALRQPSAFTNHQLLKIKGHGLPKNQKGDRGDLFVKILIDYPTKNGSQIQKEMENLPFEKQKVYVKKFKNSSFIYPRVLKFQKRMQELKEKK